jgi:hypothetical protein
MYLTAHHVASLQDHREGINAFFYLHGAYVWEGLPPDGIPDRDPGILQHQSISIPPGGNRVRSYLDIVMPDETQWTEIRHGFMTFVSESQLQQFPWTGVIGRCLFRIGMDAGLAANWQTEIANLYRAAQAVRIGG